MLTFHPVNIERELDRSNPLFVGHFFSLERMWWRKRKQRQGLILSIAMAWYRLSRKSAGSPGFVEEEVLITSLTSQVKDARVILDRFFTVKRIGYNFGGDNKAPSIISPRKLGKKMRDAVASIFDEVHFSPGLPPAGKKYTTSEVTVQPVDSQWLIKELETRGREDLIAPVSWLLQQPNPITFYFERSGSLQARDKSVWPIRAIETWPSWLRREIFGTVVDIENAFVQFIMYYLEKKYEHNIRRLELKYPDLIRADRDKQNFREELCRDILRLPVTEENLKTVKTLIMSLANGSNATPALMTNGSGRSEAVRIVHEACPHLAPTELLKVGSRLSAICKQFMAAKRDLCIFILNARPTRENQKKIFRMYFDWERDARYKIHAACGQTGLMLHDGLDGVQTDMSETELTDFIAQQTSIRVSVEKRTERVAA